MERTIVAGFSVQQGPEAIQKIHSIHFGSQGMGQRRAASPAISRCALAPDRRSGIKGDRRGCSTMVVQQPSKLNTRVRFPPPAPISLLVSILRGAWRLPRKAVEENL